MLGFSRRTSIRIWRRGGTSYKSTSRKSTRKYRKYNCNPTPSSNKFTRDTLQLSSNSLTKQSLNCNNSSQSNMKSEGNSNNQNIQSSISNSKSQLQTPSTIFIIMPGMFTTELILFNSKKKWISIIRPFKMIYNQKAKSQSLVATPNQIISKINKSISINHNN